MKNAKYQVRDTIASECSNLKSSDNFDERVGRLEEITLAIDELVEAKVLEIMRRSFAYDNDFRISSDKIESKQARLTYELALNLESLLSK